MIQGAAGTVQGYGISVGISKLGYKIWVVYIAYNCIQLVAAYYLFPETFGKIHISQNLNGTNTDKCCRS